MNNNFEPVRTSINDSRRTQIFERTLALEQQHHPFLTESKSRSISAGSEGVLIVEHMYNKVLENFLTPRIEQALRLEITELKKKAPQ